MKRHRAEPKARRVRKAKARAKVRKMVRRNICLASNLRRQESAHVATNVLIVMVPKKLAEFGRRVLLPKPRRRNLQKLRRRPLLIKPPPIRPVPKRPPQTKLAEEKARRAKAKAKAKTAMVKIGRRSSASMLKIPTKVNVLMERIASSVTTERSSMPTVITLARKRGTQRGARRTRHPVKVGMPQ